MENNYTLIIGSNSEIAKFFLFNSSLQFNNLILVSKNNYDLKSFAKTYKNLHSKATIITISADLSSLANTNKLIKKLTHYNIKVCLYFAAMNKTDSNLLLNEIHKLYFINSFSVFNIISNKHFKSTYFVIIGSIFSLMPKRCKFNYSASKLLLLKNFFKFKKGISLVNFGPVDTKDTIEPPFLKLTKLDATKIIDSHILNKKIGVFTYPLYWLYISFFIKFIP